MMRIIYVGLWLDQQSRNALANMAGEGHVVYADHVTLAFGEAVTPSHLKMVGTEVTVSTKAVVRTDDLVCVEVRGVEGCCNKHPHVTVSCAPGVRPVASNGVLDGPHSEIPYYRYISGTVGWFGLHDGDEKPSWHLDNSSE